MFKKLLKYLFLLSAIHIGCSENKNTLTTSNCYDKEYEILNAKGSSDAPKLTLGIPYEGGQISVRWNFSESANYYELEECYCPDFLAFVELYQVTESSFYPVITNGEDLYYRVRAVIGDSLTGWSNVVKY